MKKELLTIIAQAFYGNRVLTQIAYEDVDRFILGYLSDKLEIRESIDRTIIRVPNSKCVLIYNKYQEQEQLKLNKRLLEEDGYVAKPLGFIPELGVEIYSRCIACRMSEDGKLESLQRGDGAILDKYLAR